MKKLFYFFITVTLLAGCKTINEASNPNIAILTLEKTVCRGLCPVYSLSIFENGFVKYVGKKNVEKIGSFEKTLSNAEIQSLKTAFNKADIFSYKDEYTAKVTDLPTTFISYTQNGRTKRIRDYYGAPDSLKQLEDLLVAVAESQKGWKKN
jgi:hypothetical protein